MVKLKLDKIIDSIRNELEKEDSVKEELVEKARLGIRTCGDAIIYAHRNNLDKSKKNIEKAKELIKDINNILNKLPSATNFSIINDFYQEFAEAKLFIDFLEKNLYTDHIKFEISSRAFVLGLADLIGELRRYVLNSIRKEKIEEAEYALDVMEEIFDSIYNLETPKSLLSGLRRKCDIARGIIEKTRGDVTNAINSSRLTKQLKNFQNKIENKKFDNND
jgi:translin